MRRPDNEPLLFDLPLDRPARDGEAEPLLDSPRRSGRLPRSEPPPGPERSPVADRSEAPPPARPPRPPRSVPGRQGQGAAQDTLPGADDAGATEPPPAATPARAPRLPLASAAALAAQAQTHAPANGARQGPAGSAPRPAPVRSSAGELEEEAAEAPAGAAAGADRSAIGRRLAAGAADLLVHAAATTLALAGSVYLGAAPALRDWPAVAIFVLSFSFLYTVVPLAFWGHTLGMTWAGLKAESLDGEPLSFDQTARRWLGALLTVAALGLPLLLALGGRSLADRLSGSRTLVA
jgi:uncharacterized RDD family membrane protein YckC